MAMVDRAIAGRIRWRTASQKMSQRQIRMALTVSMLEMNWNTGFSGRPHTS